LRALEALELSNPDFGDSPLAEKRREVTAAPAIILAANAVAEAAIWKERTGEGQDIHVDLRKAWIEQSPWQLDAAPYTTINGAHKMFNLGSYVVQNPIVPSRDGRWMVMCPLYLCLLRTPSTAQSLMFSRLGSS